MQAYYDEGHSLVKCMKHFGFCRRSWQKAVIRGEIRPRRNGRPLEELLEHGKCRTNIKRRLLAAGMLEARCQECGLVDWLGEPLVIQLDHINGVSTDYRFQNLRMLCPNCHSQTETYGRRVARSPTRLQGSGENL